MNENTWVILLLLMALSSMHDLVESCTGHEKNMISLSYVDLPNADTFHYTRLNYPSFITDLIRKDFKYWGAIKFMVVSTNFP